MGMLGCFRFQSILKPLYASGAVSDENLSDLIASARAFGLSGPRAGESEEAARILFNRAIGRISWRLRGFVNAEDLEDATSDVLSRMMAALSSFKGTTEPQFWGWLNAITYRVGIDYARRAMGHRKFLDRLVDLFRPGRGSRSRRESDETGVDLEAPDEQSHTDAPLTGQLGLSPDEAILAKEQVDAIQSILSGMKPIDRLCAYLRFFEGYTNPQISKMVGQSEEAVAKRIYRLRLALIAELEKLGFGGEAL